MRDEVALATGIMLDFARLTGLRPASPMPLRYLWTDAFAVCNFLGLFTATGEGSFREMALELVGQVHTTLGRHRTDDERTGWISGLGEEEGRLHPTAGGLRIGKALQERKAAEPFDEALEWDRDGQYFHYLTKWMHALDRATRTTGDFTYTRWAIELARAVHARFVSSLTHGTQKRMYWKMSIDLSRPLVPSMGHHDPLDGLITYTQLSSTAAGHHEAQLRLDREILDMIAICRGKDWATEDSLGTGGLLSDAFRVAQLKAEGCFSGSSLLVSLLEAALPGLAAFGRSGQVKLPAPYRLAFRELGLSIGLRAVARLSGFIGEHRGLFDDEPAVSDRVATLGRHLPLAGAIEGFWLEPANQRAETWGEHREINMVMLATSLSPDGFLTLTR